MNYIFNNFVNKPEIMTEVSNKFNVHFEVIFNEKVILIYGENANIKKTIDYLN